MQQFISEAVFLYYLLLLSLPVLAFIVLWRLAFKSDMGAAPAPRRARQDDFPLYKRDD